MIRMAAMYDWPYDAVNAEPYPGTYILCSVTVHVVLKKKEKVLIGGKDSLLHDI